MRNDYRFLCPCEAIFTLGLVGREGLVRWSSEKGAAAEGKARRFEACEGVLAVVESVGL